MSEENSLLKLGGELDSPSEITEYSQKQQQKQQRKQR
jgi:hypothetical protein